jgi:fumarylacetoacetate (FAA) hydrolase
MCEAGPEMTFHFGQLIAHICKTRNVRAGSIVGSGTVSNKAVTVDGRQEWPKGYSCIAEKRAIETILDGKPSTAFMKFGDTIRIEMKGKDGQSVFGAIDQKIAPLAKA